LESGPHVRVRREWSTVVLVHERELYAMLRPIVIPLGLLCQRSSKMSPPPRFTSRPSSRSPTQGRDRRRWPPDWRAPPYSSGEMWAGRCLGTQPLPETGVSSNG
jgi:hypothetical protein